MVKSCLWVLNPIEMLFIVDLDGYYRRFFKGFSYIASLLTALNQMKAKFVWSENFEKNFQSFKDKVTPVLQPKVSPRSNQCHRLLGVLRQSLRDCHNT